MKKLLVLGMLVAGIGRGQDILSLSASSPPRVEGVTPSVVGAQGSNTACYRVVARYPVGNAAPSSESCVNNAFGPGGTVRVSWTPVSGATSYDVLRTNGQAPGTCTNCLLLSGTTANTATDTNATLAGYSFVAAPTANGFIQLVNGTYTTPEFFMYPYPIRVGTSLVFPDGSVQTTANVAGVGTVTHTAGNLTLNNLLCGNALADLKVCNVLTDFNSTGVLNTVNASPGVPGSFGDGANVAQITVNAKGLVTAVANVPIVGVGGTPCVTTALSFQFNNAGAFGCDPDHTFVAPHTDTYGAAAIVDYTATTLANLKYPLTQGSIVFSGAGGGLAQDNANLYYNPATPTLQVGPRGALSADATLETYSSDFNGVHVQNTGVQGANGGGGVTSYAMPAGAAMLSGSRLGVNQYGGSVDNANTLGIGAAINAIATQNWTAAHLGTKLNFNVTANNSNSRTTVLTLDQDLSATFAGSGSFAGTLSIPAAGILDMTAATPTNIKFPVGLFTVAGGNLTAQAPINFQGAGTPAGLSLTPSNPSAGNILYTLGGGSNIVLNNQANAFSTGLQDYSNNNVDIRMPNHAADPGTCSVGQVYFNTGAGQLKLCNPGNTWSSLATGGAVAWSAITNPAGALNLAMGANTSTFTTTTGVNQFFKWANTTSAVIGASQASPILSLCGTAFHAAASAEDCLTLQDTPGTGTDAAITFAVGHSGSSTGPVTTTFPGAIQAGATGGVGGTLTLPEGTAATAGASNDICYGDSTLHGVKCAWNGGSFLPLPLLTGALSAGHIVDINATTNFLEDSGLSTANAVTAGSNYVNGNLIQGAGANKTTSDSGIATLNVVTAGSNYTSGNFVQAAGNNKTTSDSGIAAARVTNQFTRTASITDLAPVVADSGLILVVDPASAIHLTRVWCAIQGATNVVVNLDKRGESTIGTDTGNHLLGADLTAVAGGASTTTFANGAGQCGGVGTCAIAAHAPVVMTFTSVSGTPTALNCSVEYTVD